jgi:hypothetical protein
MGPTIETIASQVWVQLSRKMVSFPTLLNLTFHAPTLTGAILASISEFQRPPFWND